MWSGGSEHPAARCVVGMERRQCLENKAAKGVQCRVNDVEAVTVTQALLLGGEMVCF